MSKKPTLKEILEGDLVLHDAVSIVSVNTLPEDFRTQLDAQENDQLISKDLSRETSKIIDAELAKILSYFKEPKSLLDVVRIYAKEEGENAVELLENLFEPCLDIVQRGFLISTLIKDSEEDLTPIQSDTQFEGYEIVYKVHQTEDTELYLAKDSKGSFVALKIGILKKAPQILTMLKHEASILKALTAGIAPNIIKEVYTGKFPYLVLEWVNGHSITKYASELRKEKNISGLLKLLTNIIKTYCILHEDGYLHQDIHSGNIMCSKEGNIRLIDFGLTQKIDTAYQIRAGVHSYLAPESLEKNTYIDNKMSEQYSIATLLYELFTGSSYINFSLRTEKMEEQLKTEKPRTFFEVSAESFPELEILLNKALEKHPKNRFKTLKKFANHLNMLQNKYTTPAIANTNKTQRDKFVSDTFNLFSEDSSLYNNGLPQGPLVTIFYGEAGIAYALYRYALSQDSAYHLNLAEQWIHKAFTNSRDDDAFSNPSFDTGDDIEIKYSTYNQLSGLYVVLAFISYAKGEFSKVKGSVSELLNYCHKSEVIAKDLTLDKLGIALSLIHLLQRDINDVLRDQCVEIEQAIEEILKYILNKVKNTTLIETSSTNLGIAHGVAGQLYVILKWHEYKKMNPSKKFFTQLDTLINLTIPFGSGICIPWRSTEQQSFHTISGWCNGSAGIVMLLCDVVKITQEKKYLSIIEKFIWHCWEDTDTSPNLCCGLSGRAYALSYYALLSNKSIWYTRAQYLADKAIEASKTVNLDELPTHSLYKGQLGIALMVLETSYTKQIAMPYFDSEF